jgi:hypothetical protein
VPTAAGSDVVPLRKATKERLRTLKDDATFDDVVAALLDAVDPETVRARLGSVAAAAAPPREPEKQLMIADLAARRWRERLARGQLVELAPRLFAWNTTQEVPRRANIVWPERRGFAP